MQTFFSLITTMSSQKDDQNNKRHRRKAYNYSIFHTIFSLVAVKTSVRHHWAARAGKINFNHENFFAVAEFFGRERLRCCVAITERWRPVLLAEVQWIAAEDCAEVSEHKWSGCGEECHHFWWVLWRDCFDFCFGVKSKISIFLNQSKILLN